MSEQKDTNEAACGGSALTAVLGADYAPQSLKFLGFMVITGLPSTRPDEIEFWQDGKIIGRIVGLAPNNEVRGGALAPSQRNEVERS